MANIKLKLKAIKDIVEVKALIKHPMETGLRKKKGKLVPANHIEHMEVLLNDTKVVDADIGSSVSKNPYFKFRVAGKKGDTVELKYKDNNGKTGAQAGTV